MNTSRKVRLLSILTIVSAIVVSTSLIAHATSRDDIAYPVRELGNCANEAECREFCEDRSNLIKVKQCIAFANTHKLLTPDELEEAERYVSRLGITIGPGGCRSERECEAYCEDTAHLGVCLDFAERYKLRSTEEIAEGRGVLTAIENGANLPGGCSTKNQCDTYCEDPMHMRECVTFAEKAGFISPKELAEAQKIIPLLERGEKTPGNCGRKAVCEAYCMEGSHIDECLRFAEKAGLLPPEELADAKRFAPYIKNGETPGQCKRKAECEAYCEMPEHFEECVSFAEKVGMLSNKEAELARELKGRGPGGCSSRSACEDFCGRVENQKDCVAFAKEHGFAEEISEIETKIRGEVETKMRTCAEKACTEFISCLQNLRTGVENSSAQGEEMLPADIKDKLNICIAGEREREAGEIDNKAIFCAEKPCPEMISCLQGLQSGGDNGEERGAGDLPGEVQEKLTYCIANLKTQAVENIMGGESVPPPGGVMPQSDDATEGAQRQYEEEYQRQYQEQLKTQVDCSLFDAAPTCDYVGPQGSQNYELCKQCFPNK